jgi:hypothetical protein
MNYKNVESNSIFEQLNVFPGEWESEVSKEGIPLARAKAYFKWFDNHSFLILKAEADPPLATTPKIWIDNNPNPIDVVISLDDISGQFYYIYADARGVRRVYQMNLENDLWEIWGKAGPKFFQHFEGKFSRDKNSIVAKWEKSTNAKDWELDFDVKYTRISKPANKHNS